METSCDRSSIRSFFSFPALREARRSLFSARKIALMASVVAGLGFAVYGLDSLPGGFDILTSPRMRRSTPMSAKLRSRSDSPMSCTREAFGHFSQSYDER